MAMVTADRREREKAERRASILAAARTIFFTKGFHNTTVEEVADRAEVSKGTVYLYFDSKEVILAHVLLDALDHLVADLERAASRDQDMPAGVRVRRLADAYLQFFLTHPDTYGLIMGIGRSHAPLSAGGEAMDVPAAIYSEVLTRSLHGFDLLVRAIERGVDSGHFSTTTPRETAAALWASLNGVLALLAHPLRREVLGVEIEALYQAVLSMSLRGIRLLDDGP